MVEHVRACAHCRELFRSDAQLGRRLASASREAPSDLEQLARVEVALDHERGARAFLRSRSTRVRSALLLGLAALLLLAESIRQRVPWRSLSEPRLLVALLLLALLVLVTRSVLRPPPIARRSARLRSALAVVAWCLPCVLWLVPDAQASRDEFNGQFALRSFACFAYGSVLAAPAFALCWALDRGMDVSFRVWALGAGIVALVSNLILVLHCPATDRAHLVAGHFSIGLAWLLMVSLGEWWRRRV